MGVYVAFSTQQFVSTGVEDHLILSFPYIDRGDIHLFVDTIEVPFTWASASRINFTPAPVGAVVLCRRTTRRDRVAYLLQEGAPFTREVLDSIHTQLLYLEQEGFEGNIGALFGDLDMHGFRIRNAGDPQLPGDYSTRQWVEQQIQNVNADYGLRNDIKETSGSLSLTSAWEAVPRYSNPDVSPTLNAPIQALGDRTEQLRQDDGALGGRINGRNSMDGITTQALAQLETAYNGLGATLDGNISYRVDFTAAQTDTQSRLLYALQNIPSGHVFERMLNFGSVYCIMSLRPVAARLSVGSLASTYALVDYNGKQYHTITIRGDVRHKFRMSYVDKVLRTPAETIEYLKLRFVRVMLNASPVGSGGVDDFPTTINNGKLIPGSETNTYFQSSCFFSADGVLHVVPHKGQNVADVVRNYYYNHDAIQAMHFRYVLVKDGAVYDLVANGYTTEAGWTGTPSGRTSIGQKANGDLVLAVIDGNTSAGTGVSVKEMSEYMLFAGCVNAMNLDGSGSSTMYYSNERKNNPSDGAERKMVNVIYFL